jgi:hypothetical protein
VDVRRLGDQLYCHRDLGAVSLEVIVEHGADRASIVRFTDDLGVGVPALIPKIKRDGHQLNV